MDGIGIVFLSIEIRLKEMTVLNVTNVNQVATRTLGGWLLQQGWNLP